MTNCAFLALQIMHAGIVLSEIIYCAVKWLKFTSKILIYVYLYLIKLNTNSKSVFVNKGSPVSAVLYTPYTDQFIYIYIHIYKYLGHKMSSSNYEFGPL